MASRAAPASRPIRIWNWRWKRSKSGWPSAGRAKAGSAPGGYSTRKSRYGTFPSTIASPKRWYSIVSRISRCV